MVELFEQNERQNDRQSSKGNQLKWKMTGYGIRLITLGMKDLQSI